jgi:cytochrome c1
MMRRWTTAQVYWIISNGVKMTGMPAWRTRLSDDDVWAVTAFVARLPALSKQDYAALAGAARAAEQVVVAPARADAGRDYAFTAVSAARGRVAIPQYGCQSCHVIPGIVGGRVAVGPPLDHYGARLYIAGHLPNTPENLVRWLRSPDAVKPQTTMPNLGLGERDAADIAAYLLGPK